MVQTSAPIQDGLDTSKLRYIDVDGIRTRIYEDGTGEPFIMFHGGQFGMNSTLDAFSLNLPFLAQHFRVIAVDKLGQGYTDNPKRDEDYTFEALFEHLKGVLREVGFDRGIVFGHSRGGLPALRIAIEFPEKTRKLVIADSNTASPDPDMAGPFNARMKELLPPDLSPRETVKRMGTANSFSADHLTDDYLDRMEAIAALPNNREGNAKMKTLGPTVWMPSLHRARQATFDFLEQQGLPMPVLMTWGKNAESAPVRQGLALFDLLCKHTPNVAMHIFNRAGHHSFREQAHDFHKLVLSFCAD